MAFSSWSRRPIRSIPKPTPASCLRRPAASTSKSSRNNMRYFLLIFALAVVTVMGVFGKRGHTFKQPPLEIFPDMDRQPKLRPQQPSVTFANGRSSQEPVLGTVARGDHYENNSINTAREPGSTNFVAAIPLPVTEQL